MVMPQNRYKNIDEYVKALETENLKLIEKNSFLSRKNKVNTLRLRLIRTYLNTLSTDSYSYGGDSDLYDYAVCKTNAETTNVINKIVSSIPDPKVANKNRWMLMRVFEEWKKPGTNTTRRSRKARVS